MSAKASRNNGRVRRRTLSSLTSGAAFRTQRGGFLACDCRGYLKTVPDETFDLVITSPPYDGQPKYGNGERYDRDWFQGFFLEVTGELLRVLKPNGSFVLNYRSKRRRHERGTLQFEIVFWLREQGFLFCEDFVWAKPSPPPGRFRRYLKDAVEYCFHFAKSPHWQFSPSRFSRRPAGMLLIERGGGALRKTMSGRPVRRAMGASVYRRVRIGCDRQRFYRWSPSSVPTLRVTRHAFPCTYRSSLSKS